jgi:hypothetical protein
MVEIKQLEAWQMVSRKAVLGLAVVLSGMMPSAPWETIAAEFPAQEGVAMAPVLAQDRKAEGDRTTLTHLHSQRIHQCLSWSPGGYNKRSQKLSHKLGL